jgi:hypothetical protein
MVMLRQQATFFYLSTIFSLLVQVAVFVLEPFTSRNGKTNVLTICYKDKCVIINYFSNKNIFFGKEPL